MSIHQQTGKLLWISDLNIQTNSIASMKQDLTSNMTFLWNIIKAKSIEKYSSSAEQALMRWQWTHSSMWNCSLPENSKKNVKRFKNINKMWATDKYNRKADLFLLYAFNNNYLEIIWHSFFEAGRWISKLFISCRHFSYHLGTMVGNVWKSL